MEKMRDKLKHGPAKKRYWFEEWRTNKDHRRDKIKQSSLKHGKQKRKLLNKVPLWEQKT